MIYVNKVFCYLQNSMYNIITPKEMHLPTILIYSLSINHDLRFKGKKKIREVKEKKKQSKIPFLSHVKGI